jgi:alkylmercury lyase
MANPPNIDSLAEEIGTAVSRLDPRDQQIALILLRQLALGERVSVDHLAGAADLSEAQTAAALERLPMVVRDAGERIVGFNGLAADEMGHHRIHLDGRTLSAWCAWDTLFLPELLGAQCVSVTSRSPASGADIALTVTSTGLHDLDPPDTVVSLLLPAGDIGADVIQRFCHFVHFFASDDDGEQWVSEHPGTFLVSVDGAYRLGQLVNNARFGDALATAGRR